MSILISLNFLRLHCEILYFPKETDMFKGIFKFLFWKITYKASYELHQSLSCFHSCTTLPDCASTLVMVMNCFCILKKIIVFIGKQYSVHEEYWKSSSTVPSKLQKEFPKLFLINKGPASKDGSFDKEWGRKMC